MNQRVRTNEVTTRAATKVAPVLPAAPVLPPLPAPLARVVRMVVEPGAGPPLAIFRPDERDAAQEALASREMALGRPASREMIDAWLTMLVPGPRQAPPSQDDFNAYLRLVVVASGDLPAAVWSEESLGEALRKFKWWPSPADLDELLRGLANRQAAELRALRAIAGPAPGDPREVVAAEPAEPRITPQQVREVLDKWGVGAGARRSRLPPEAPAAEAKPLPEPSPQMREAMIAQWREQAKGQGPFAELARTRLAMAERQAPIIEGGAG